MVLAARIIALWRDASWLSRSFPPRLPGHDIFATFLTSLYKLGAILVNMMRGGLRSGSLQKVLRAIGIRAAQVIRPRDQEACGQ